jgi:hypothetical protein
MIHLHALANIDFSQSASRKGPTVDSTAQVLFGVSGLPSKLVLRAMYAKGTLAR